MSRRRIDPTIQTTVAPKKRPGTLTSSDRKLLALCLGTTVAAGIFHNSGGNSVVSFTSAAVALAMLASLVGRSVEALGDRLGAGATGVLQSFLANLPEIFVILFSLKAGLYEVVKATIVGSILANVLLIAGLAFFFGGLKHGRQKFDAAASQQLGLLLVLSVFVLSIPTLTSALHTPAAEHERTLTMAVSVALLVLFLASLPETLRRGKNQSPITGSQEALAAKSVAAHHGQWPLALAFTMLGLSGVGAAFVSEWFVSALSPAMDTLHISQAFAGLIIVAIAGNAVENVVGIQLAMKNKSEYAIQIILQSPVQVAMVVAPVIALSAPLVGAGTFTLVFTPLLLGVLFMATFTAATVVSDGESTWFEGATLLALYVAIAVSFWWG
ncbi:MAG: sodium:proton exchanger [Actinomycetes bacterium]